MKKLVSVICVLTSCGLALALSSFGSIFEKTYKVSKDSPLADAKCSVCHVGKKGGKLNPYGADLAKVMKAENTRKLTAELLHKIDDLDSLKTGSKNIDRIKAGKNPGLK